MKHKPIHITILLFAVVLSAATHAAEIVISAPNSPLLCFAIRKLEAALEKQSNTLRRTNETPTQDSGLVVAVDPAQLEKIGSEGFTHTRSQNVLKITSTEARGAMYGVLDIAEQIRMGTPWEKIETRTVKPRLDFRAIKYNLPWSAYRTSPALEQHRETCKDLKYWDAFLDMMAENRFNVLTLWSMHPYTYMIRPKNFPEACPFNDREMAEWNKLWSSIFAMAKERGIETYLLNWNIFVSPEFSKTHHVAPWSVSLSHIGGKEDTTNEVVVKYTKEIVTQLLNEYPDLTGLGITLGERMGGMTPEQRRKWLDDTFFAGIAEAKRPAKFIYRAPLSANTGSGGTTSEENDRLTRKQIESLSKNITGPVYVEFKHNWSHGHSSPDLFMVHGGPLSDAYWNPKPTRHEVVWTMRNEDMYILRWGQPDFVRNFIQRQDEKDYVAGAIIGSECYIPALDYITKEGPHKTWNWAFQRQWLFYAVWGKLLYDPTTPDTRFEGLFEERFGNGTGGDLLAAWKLASQVPLHFASFYRGTWDGTLYTEGFSSWIDKDDGARTFFGVDALIKQPVLDTKRYINISDFVKSDGVVEPGKLSPLALADELDRNATEAIKKVTSLRTKTKPSATLECELTDIEAWSAYANYFAEKMRGGVALATARQKKDTAQQALAISSFEKALTHWKHLAELGEKFNQLPILSNSKQPFSWSSLTPAVEKDLQISRIPLDNLPRPIEQTPFPSSPP